MGAFIPASAFAALLLLSSGENVQIPPSFFFILTTMILSGNPMIVLRNGDETSIKRMYFYTFFNKSNQIERALKTHRYCCCKLF